MSKTPEIDVRALAQLARIEVSDVEAEKLEAELPAILGLVDMIQRADAFAIDRHPALRNVMRDDTDPHESGLYTDKLLAAAPQVKDGRIVVKQVISRKTK